MHQWKIRKNERGQIFALIAVLIGVLVLFVGLAIDFGQAYVTKTTLNKAVDAATLAAMRNLNSPAGESGATADAIAAFKANYQSGPGLGTVPTPTVTWFTTAPCIQGNTCVTVSATTSINTYFIRALGSQFATLNVSDSATAQRNPLVMSLMLDRSGSMQNNGGSTVLGADVKDFISYFDEGIDNIAEISFAGAQSDDVLMTTNFVTPIDNSAEGLTYRGGTYAYGAMLDGDTQILSKPLTPNIIRVAVFFTDGYANTVNDSLNCTGTAKKPVLTNWNYGGCAFVSGGVDECNTVFFMNPTTGDWTNGKPAFNGTTNTCPNATTFPAQMPGLNNTISAANITQDGTYRTEQLATKMRTTDQITIYAIGLGSLINEPYLHQLANDKSSSTYDSTQPSGEAIFAPTAAQLDAVFQTIASKILLRLSQ